MNDGHPAWQEYLKDVPEAMRPLVSQAFQKWDANVTQRFQEIHNEYAPIKALTEQGLTLEDVTEAVNFAQYFQENPQQVIQHANQQWNLGYVSKDEAEKLHQQAQQSGNNEDFSLDGIDMQDLAKLPAFQQLSEQIESLKSGFEQERLEREEEQAIQAHLNQLDGLLKDKPNIDPELVTAYMVQGNLSPQKAIEKVESQLAKYIGDGTNNTSQQQTNTPEPPPVMGGAGQSGSGLPDQSIDFGGLSNGKMTDLVTQMVIAAQQNEQT